jgi:hypothetical protein
MKKVNKKLTDQQKVDGVIFSSTLSECRTEQISDTVHLVLDSDEDKIEKINRLLDDSFFNRSHFVFNIIRK